MRRAVPVPLLVLVLVGTAAAQTTTTTASGTTTTTVKPRASSCTCYEGYDEECPEGFVCDGNFDDSKCTRMKGPGDNRRQQKGGAWRPDGKGCTLPYDPPDAKTAPCDATCVPREKGSKCAQGDPDAVGQSIYLWGQAMTQPAEQGGGPIDPALAAQARAVPINPACSDHLGWRMLGVMELCRGNDFIIHPDTQHDHPEDHLVADISGDTCRIQSGNVCVQALMAGLHDSAAVDGILDTIPSFCPTLPFGNAGLAGTGLDAVKDRIRTTARYLTTPLPEESGFTPPDAATKHCEDGVAKNVARFLGCIMKCHTRAASAAFKGGAFDLVACETTRSCRAKYDRGVMTLLAHGGCPPCLDATHQATLADHSESTLDDDNGLVYCVGP